MTQTLTQHREAYKKERERIGEQIYELMVRYDALDVLIGELDGLITSPPLSSPQPPSASPSRRGRKGKSRV